MTRKRLNLLSWMRLGVYYEIDINVKESTYSMRTYSVTEDYKSDEI